MSNENKNIPLELQYDAVYILDLNTQTFERIRTIDSVRRPNGPYVVVKLFCNTLFDKYLTVTSLHRC